MLPSGREVALDPTPFWTLLDGIDSPTNAHVIMALKSREDLQQLIDVLLVFDEDSASPDLILRAEQDAVGELPPGKIGIRSGYRLASWRDIADDWSLADLQAMEEFVSQRALPLCDGLLKAAQRAQQTLLSHPELEAGLFAHMWELGIHPLQDGEGDE